MRTFHLVRGDDISGVSGTGIVAEGVEFTGGRCLVHWITETAPESINQYNTLRDVVKIHGHENHTKIVMGNNIVISVTLSNGEICLIDEEDLGKIDKVKWHCYARRNRNSQNYAFTSTYNKGKRGNIQMHRLLAVNPDGLSIDHINGDGLDNRKCNLRPCTNSQNHRNIGKSKKPNPTSKFKGVDFLKSSGKWRARIRIKDQEISLGCYIDETDAALAYNKAALQLFGEFAKLNEVEMPEKGDIV